MACAQRTSSVISSAQPSMFPLLGSNGGTVFGCWSVVKLDVGRSNVLFWIARSPATNGFEKASTITIVLPVPSTPDPSSPE